MTHRYAAEMAAVSTVVVASLLALLLLAFDLTASGIAAASVLLIAVGVGHGMRPITGFGVIGLAIGALVGAQGASTSIALLLYGAAGLVCTMAATGSDVSFLARRESQISPEVLSGKLISALTVGLTGVGISVAVLGAILAMRWPGWIVPLPLLILAICAGLGARVLVKHRHRIERPKLHR